MVVTTDLLTKSTMEVARKKDATVSEENTMTTHTALHDIHFISNLTYLIKLYQD